ncbi:MAG TPA: dienelactone hydrolase family protein [Thermoanaerobaculia bacterium]|nr:dienelactone hydrolase family protein [Thermoanaerobaculia bacterium]
MRSLLFALLLLPAMASADETPWWKRPLLYPIRGKSHVRENVVYRTDGGTKLLADIYTPASGAKQPIVILIHGGPVPPDSPMKDLPVFRDYGRLLAGEGFVAVTFNHRYYQANELATAAADVDALIDYVRAAGVGNRDNVVLWFFSGGGPLLTLGFDKPYVRALIDYYAILDGPAPYDPIARAAEIRVPLLIERGGRDMAEVNEPLKRFLDAALAHNVNLELLNHPAGEHAFDIVNDDARTRQIIARTLAFLRELPPR